MSATATIPAADHLDVQAPTLPGLEPDPVANLFRWAIDQRASIHLVGPHGIGKTAYVTALARRHGLRVVTKSLPVCTQRDFCVPLPVTQPDGTRAIEVLVLDELLQRHPDDRYVLVLDELSRASSDTLNTAMELLQEHTLAGQELPGLAAVIALDNPHDDPDYAGVQELDLAQADRVAAIDVTADHIPWVAHLEAVHEVDLADFHQTWRNLATWHRRILCPRVVDHLLHLWRAGLPVEWALPVLGDGRTRLATSPCIIQDHTDEVLDALVAALPERSRRGPSEPAGGPGGRDVVAAVASGIQRGWNIRLVGAPGIGKTSHVRAAVAESGLDMVYLSLSQTSPSDLVVPVPVDGRLDFLPARRLVDPGRRYVLVLDEFSRASEDVAAAAMELVNERSLAGRSLPGCVAVVALDNPARAGAITFDAGRIDAAQASRFTCTIEVTEDDLPWRDYLADRWPATAQVFIDWRAEDLDDDVRALVSPRCLDRMMSLHQAGLDPEVGLPRLGGERVPAPIIALRRRLDGGPARGLAALLRDLDAVVARLRGGDADTEVAVGTALQRADRSALEANRDGVSALFAALPPALRLSLVRTGTARRDLFIELLANVPVPGVARAGAASTKEN